MRDIKNLISTLDCVKKKNITRKLKRRKYPTNQFELPQYHISSFKTKLLASI